MTTGVEGRLRAFRRAATGAAIVTAVGVLAPACGGGSARVATATPVAKPPAAPALGLMRIGIVGPHSVDGYQFIGVPYVVAVNKVPGPGGTHSYEIFFRLNRLLRHFGKSAGSGAMAVATVDGGYDDFSLMYQLPGTSVPCYSETIEGATFKYGAPSSLPSLVLPHGPGQIARLALFTAQADPGPTLQANVRVSREIMGDMVPSSGGPGTYEYFPAGPYGRLLGCDSHVPGELTWRLYAELRREGKASTG